MIEYSEEQVLFKLCVLKFYSDEPRGMLIIKIAQDESIKEDELAAFLAAQAEAQEGG